MGGPIYKVAYKDDLRLPVLPRGTGLNTDHDDTDSVIVRKRKGKSRLRSNGTDVVFYTSEGVMQVACAS